jgi:hypothetical protein
MAEYIAELLKGANFSTDSRICVVRCLHKRATKHHRRFNSLQQAPVAGTTNPRHEGIGQCLVLDGLLLAGRLAFVLVSCLNSVSFPFDFRLVFVWFSFGFRLVSFLVLAGPFGLF